MSLPIDDGGSAETARLVFVGETDRTVREILAARGVDEDGQDREEVADWLVDHLRENGGRAKAAEVFRAGRAQGYSESPIKRAKAAVGITSEKDGMRGGWGWQLPRRGHEGAEGNSTRRPDAMKERGLRSSWVPG